MTNRHNPQVSLRVSLRQTEALWLHLSTPARPPYVRARRQDVENHCLAHDRHCLHFGIACGSSGNGSKSASNASPVGPSPIAENSSAPASTGTMAVTPQRLGPIRPQSLAVSGPQDVAFPPRNEPFDFRANALEVRYRDGLRRPADFELRRHRRHHRLDAGVPALSRQSVRATRSRSTRSSRRSTVWASRMCVASRRQARRRSRRATSRSRSGSSSRSNIATVSGASRCQTFVDPEGDVIWTQEYMRYRVSSCSHADAIAKVMAQIDGAGVPADCTPKPLFAQFVVSGPLGSDRCRAPASGFADCTFNGSTSTGPSGDHALRLDLQHASCDRHGYGRRVRARRSAATSRQARRRISRLLSRSP